jgi:hypothetical protein
MTENNPSAVEDLAVSIWLHDPASPDKMADLRKITGNPLEDHRHGLNCMNFEMALVNRRTADTMPINISSMGWIGEWRGFWAIGEEGGLTVTGQSSANGRKQWD